MGREPDGDPWEVAAAVAGVLEDVGRGTRLPGHSRAVWLRAVQERSSANVIDTLTSLEVDLFMAGGTPLDRDALDRRVATVSADVARPLHVHTPEDVLLQKLRWYRRGGEVSDRQWRDVIGIVRVQGTRLDRSYLTCGAALLHVSDLPNGYWPRSRLAFDRWSA